MSAMFSYLSKNGNENSDREEMTYCQLLYYTMMEFIRQPYEQEYSDHFAQDC